MMDFCDITKKIAEFPHENVQMWGVKTIRDLLDYKAHVDACLDCQALIDSVIEAYKDESESFDPTSLN